MSHDTLRVRLLAFLFLIPLALYAWSAVQAFRVDSTLRDEQFMRDWSASVRNDPDTAGAIPRHLFRPAYGVEGHLHQFAEDAEAIRRDHPWLALRGWLAAIGKLCALASALVAAVLLARLEYDGRRSMRSQAYLLGHLAPAWRRLGRLVPLHAGLLVAALASQLLYEALWSYSHWHSHGFVALLFSLPLWLLFLGGLLMLRRLHGELLPLEEPVLHLLGRELDRVAAPGLWQWLGQIADRAGAPLPDHVVTGIEHCYFVTQAKVLLAPRGIPLEGRTLYIPLTYASVMSEAESAAIIGHELGHFAAGDTAHGASLSLLQRQVRLRIERIAAPEDGHVGLLGKPGLWAALYFLDRFERAYLHWNRRQELAADKVGARVAGARVFAIALLRTCALAGLIERLLASPQTRNLVHALTDHLRGNSLELDEHDSARRLEHPFDSHPPTYQRIADLSLALDDDLLRQARRIVSADDTQWLNRLLDAGHGESR
ncbi:peptidase [Pseudomonas aeruginosa]|uniref:M48 family metalloprotease n=1 Tax=Pseudomonas aeruginosa TaxID=287 RepID=UPI001068424F|nr:M48 family metallopeptidase [Pseudomonas aeruginosa]TEG50982.1 peptidase [Pseudomonas aeruginosa]TEH15063.1 peptidase [Pseudomonas aeruginosa]HCF7060948.1 M48 family metalloprotease [Pseudomonas aeruginosa]